MRVHTISQDETEDPATPDVASLDDEEALVRKAKDGREDAWTVIYESNFPAIFRYVRARVYDEAAAADIAASVFVAAVTGIRTYRYCGRPLLAWLYRIAHNLVGDYQRKTLRERRKTGGRPLEVVHHTNGTGPAGDPAAIIEDLDLRAALDTLPDSQRDVLILRFFVGLSTQEIADVLGKQAAAVYSLQARAVASLRNILQ